jgi:murein DD-endopeptidase MepM/ murein hydrolase activator NlpD
VLLRLLGLLCLVPLAVGLAGVLPAEPAVAGAVPGTGWQLPLAGVARVVAPFEAPAGPYAPGHRGVDLAGAPAEQVLAAGAGVVAFAGRVASRGVVSVDHPGGLRTTYLPVSAVVHTGEAVAAGAVLGLLAGAGGHCLPSACLHWGLRRGAAYLDPMGLLGAVRVRLLPVWSASTRLLPPPPVAAVLAAPRGTARAARDPTAGDHPGGGPRGAAALAPFVVLTGGLASAGLVTRRLLRGAPP